MSLIVDLDDIHNFPRDISCGLQEIESLICNALNYSEFFKKFLYLNKPCIVRNVTVDWFCQKFWVKDDKPNLPFIEENYGESVVPVANCNEKYFNSQNKSSMTLREYVSYWNKSTTKEDEGSSCLYLKDWHFVKEYPNSVVYKLPEYFSSDWLNEYLLRNPHFEDDYRFVYMGPKGSWTPFHSDVFSSFSWSVNLCGRKKWAFYPPGEETKLCDRFGNLPYSLESEDLKDHNLYPNQGDLSEPFMLFQGVGDAVFVPSGWHHQVWNLEDTISVNHNWINACNISRMYKDIMKNLNEVVAEIKDCEDMEGWDDQCQLLLKSVYGMDINDFSSFLFYIGNVRLDALRDNNTLKTNHSDYSFGTNHILFDLFSLQSVLNDMLKDKTPCLEKSEEQLIKLSESISNFKEL